MISTTLFRSFTWAFVAILLAGCNDITTPPDPLESSTENVTNYGRQPNGTGIHVASTQPLSWFGLSNLSVPWFMTGFSQHADGSYWATGWYSLSIGIISADALVIGALVSGANTNWQVQAIRTTGSSLSVELRDAQGHVQTLQGSALVGLTFRCRVPDPTGLLTTIYRLRISSAEDLYSKFGDVHGYQVDYALETLLGSLYTSFCKGAIGESQRAVFYQGSQWDPSDGGRRDGANLITMTCESGSVARCMSWGYRPWGNGQNQNGQAASFADHHQACIHMKRASYCGDSRSNTIDGTPIYVQDRLNPPLYDGSMAVLEALWNPSGAVCLSNRRHPELPFLGCAQPLPDCSGYSGDYLIADGLAASGALNALLD